MNRSLAPLVLVAVLATQVPVLAQTPRKDYIWARSTSSTLTLDGLLNEPAWALADSMNIVFGQDTLLIPGSGFFYEGGVLPNDPTNATIRFLRSMSLSAGEALEAALCAAEATVSPHTRPGTTIGSRKSAPLQ